MKLEAREMILDYWGRWPSQDEVRAHLHHHSGRSALKPMGKPCHDCAVTCGFYAPISASLSLLPADEIKAISERWYCHNNPGRACAGNIEFQRAVTTPYHRKTG